MASTTPVFTPQFWRKLVIDLAILIVVGVVLALIGPFGSFQASFPQRLVYWVSLALAGHACYRPIGWLVSRYGAVLELPSWFLWGLACLIATVPMTLFVAGIDRVPQGLPMPPFSTLLVYYGNVLIVGVMITALFFLLERAAAAAPATGMSTAVPAPVPQPAPETLSATQPAAGAGDIRAPLRFLDRLPAHLGTDLIALEMEDHYVRAHTILGSELVLMRLRDAMAELDGMEGQQVHRSWWVARHAVEEVRRDGRNLRLILPGGLEAPVARANAATLKQLGWI